jgi:NnrS protein/Domain of unknown function (DUF1858)
MSTSAAWLNERVMIPDLLRAAPQARPVLDRYGLRGCGGPLGPMESLAFFARAHEVPIARLLTEIRAGLRRPATAAEMAAPENRLADGIYRPFFRAGIVVVLTLGAVWGAYLLLRIALEGSFAAASLHDVNAHGQAQIFGWVGLFVMGFAYQAFPRFKHASLAHPRIAHATLWLMLAGLVGRSVLEPLAAAQPWLAPGAVAASALEVLAVGLFVGVIVATWRASGKRLAFYDAYILSALVWFFVQAVYESVYLAATLAATDRDQLVGLASLWQAPLRDIQIHGFALLMILGVSQRIFHHFYGLPAPNPRLSLAALGLLNLALVGETTGLVLMRTAGHAWAALWYGSVIVLAATVVLLLCDWRIFSRPRETDRGLKFLRTAYAWLLVSLGMLLLFPAYQFVLLPLLAPASEAARIGFSHAFYGATRHAVTVGFVSLMIVGVASKIVPTLGGVDVRRLSPLWGPFVLLNVGCALRVVAQTLTDFTPAAYPVAGASGLLEVFALALWGAHLWRIMSGRAAAAGAAPAHVPLTDGRPIAPDHLVGDVLDQYPHLLAVFLSFGFHPLGNSLLRQAVAGHVTIGRACRLLDMDAPRLIEALNAARERLGAAKISLPVLSFE